MDTGIARDDRADPPPARPRCVAPLVVVVPSGTPTGALPPPPPPPFAGLPEPTRCLLPALGWQARRDRQRPARHASEADRSLSPMPAVGPPHDDAAATGSATDELEPIEIRVAAAFVHDGTEDRQLVAVARQVGRGMAYAVVGAAGWLLLITTLPRVVGWQPTVITGRSMEPSIERGDVVIVRPLPSSAYVPGVVITFDDASRAGRLVTHRLVEVRSDGTLVTKGDNNRDDDPLPLDARRVRGRAVLRLPFAGRVVVWFLDRRWLPLALTFAVLAAAIVTVLRPCAASLRASRRAAATRRRTSRPGSTCRPRGSRAA